MGTKNKNKVVVVNKEVKEKKCLHGKILGQPCSECDKDQDVLSKNVDKTLDKMKETLSKMKKTGWAAFFWPKTNIIRFKNPNKEHCFYCPITGACEFLEGKTFGNSVVHEAARKINIKFGFRQIVDAVDNDEKFLLDEKSKEFRNFVIKEFALEKVKNDDIKRDPSQPSKI